MLLHIVPLMLVLPNHIVWPSVHMSEVYISEVFLITYIQRHIYIILLSHNYFTLCIYDRIGWKKICEIHWKKVSERKIWFPLQNMSLYTICWASRVASSVYTLMVTYIYIYYSSPTHLSLSHYSSFHHHSSTFLIPYNIYVGIWIYYIYKYTHASMVWIVVKLDDILRSWESFQKERELFLDWLPAYYEDLIKTLQAEVHIIDILYTHNTICVYTYTCYIRSYIWLTCTI